MTKPPTLRVPCTEIQRLCRECNCLSWLPNLTRILSHNQPAKPQSGQVPATMSQIIDPATALTSASHQHPMQYMINHPRFLTLACLLAMGLVAQLAALLRSSHQRRNPARDDQIRESLTLVVSATLTLLGLIIGFTFSMATTRYDQRKLYEEQEANAIGTEYVRAELLPAPQTAHIKSLLVQYLHRRIAFYTSTENPQNSTLDRDTAALQTSLWNAIKPQAATSPNPVEAIVVSGMNDVLNSQGYTQFAWWNRIPTAAWYFMIGISLFSNLLVGYATPRFRQAWLLLWVLPIIVSVSFFLVADIDSPRGGLIHVAPRDLMALADSCR